MNYNNLFIEKNLPNLLSKEEASSLFAEMRNNIKTAKDELIKHNIRLVIYEVTHKYYNNNYDKKDLVSIGLIGLIKAVNTFDLNRNAEFSTYAVKCINNEISSFLRKVKKDNILRSLQEPIFDDESNTLLEDEIKDDYDIEEEYEKRDLYILLKELIDSLSERDKEIVILHFGFKGKPYTLRKLSDMFNISPSYIGIIVKKVLKQFKKRLIELDAVETNKFYNTECYHESLTIYDLFINHSKEDIDKAISMLNEDEINAVNLRFNNEYETIGFVPLELILNFSEIVVPKIKALLKENS